LYVRTETKTDKIRTGLQIIQRKIIADQNPLGEKFDSER